MEEVHIGFIAKVHIGLKNYFTFLAFSQIKKI